jgi:hypothetical protein
MMGITSPTGSHLPMLEAAASKATGLVIEHGAGLYSTPLLARLGCRVLCVEPHPGWREWAQWIYQGRAEMCDSWKAATLRLADASLVFIDGPALERGPLLQACLDRDVPTIIAHDTDEEDWKSYNFQPHHFTMSRYEVTHHDDTHRTTQWRRHTGVPFNP